MLDDIDCSKQLYRNCAEVLAKDFKDKYEDGPGPSDETEDDFDDDEGVSI